MRTNCAVLISAVVLGGSGLSCTASGKSGPRDASGAGEGGGSSSGTANDGSTAVTVSDGGGGPDDAAGRVPDASAVDGSPGREDAAVGDGGPVRDSGASEGPCEGGTPGPVAGTCSIFDGKDLNGWVQSGTLFSVVDGVIDGKGTTGGELLVTDANYGDFRIVVSSILVATGGTGHLGICFWGGRTPVGQYNGCKLIIPPWGDTWDYSLGHGLDGVTNLASSPDQNASTWSTAEILCFLAKGFCQVAIDGTAVLTYQEPNLKSIQSGPIGLQLHDGTNEEVQYKDVYVDPAPTVDMLLTVK